MSNQTVIGGFTVSFNGVTPVSGGYEWSYTITNNGKEKDLSNWVLQLKNCLEVEEKLSCSLGVCEIVNQVCPEPQKDCGTFRGIKFDNLPPDQLTQTFTFVLPIAAVPTLGCFYLKYGQNKVCGEILVPDCTDDPPCPPCPTSSIRDGKTFTYQVEGIKSACDFSFEQGDSPSYYLCANGLKLNSGKCDISHQVTLCENTDSEQTLNCLVPLEYVEVSGELQIFWQLKGNLETYCAEQPVSLTMMAVTNIELTEICYFCDGERPDFKPEDVCNWFEINFVSISASGLLTYTVTFLGCEESNEE
jgi:hypothetical protein